MKFRFHYKPIWNEILSIVSRDSRIIAVSSEYVLSELLTALIDFLRGARSLLYTIGKFLLLNHILYIRISTKILQYVGRNKENATHCSGTKYIELFGY